MRNKIIAVIGPSGSGKSAFISVCPAELNRWSDSSFTFSCSSQVLCGSAALAQTEKTLQAKVPLPPTGVGQGYKKENLLVMRVNAIRNRRKFPQSGSRDMFVSIWDMSGKSYSTYLSHNDIGAYVRDLKSRAHPDVLDYYREASHYLGNPSKLSMNDAPSMPYQWDLCLVPENIDLLCIDNMLSKADGVILLLDKGHVEGEEFSQFWIDNLIARIERQKNGILRRFFGFRSVVPIAIVFSRIDLHGHFDPDEYALHQPKVSSLVNRLQKGWGKEVCFFTCTSFGDGNHDGEPRTNTPKDYPLVPRHVAEIFDWLIDRM